MLQAPYSALTASIQAKQKRKYETIIRTKHQGKKSRRNTELPDMTMR